MAKSVYDKEVCYKEGEEWKKGMIKLETSEGIQFIRVVDLMDVSGHKEVETIVECLVIDGFDTDVILALDGPLLHKCKNIILKNSSIFELNAISNDYLVKNRINAEMIAVYGELTNLKIGLAEVGYVRVPSSVKRLNISNSTKIIDLLNIVEKNKDEELFDLEIHEGDP